jgi:hypothetical protein
MTVSRLKGVVRHRNHAAKTKGIRGLEMTEIDATKPASDARNSRRPVDLEFLAAVG